MSNVFPRTRSTFWLSIGRQKCYGRLMILGQLMLASNAMGGEKTVWLWCWVLEIYYDRQTANRVPQNYLNVVGCCSAKSCCIYPCLVRLQANSLIISDEWCTLDINNSLFPYHTTAFFVSPFDYSNLSVNFSSVMIERWLTSKHKSSFLRLCSKMTFKIEKKMLTSILIEVYLVWRLNLFYL